MVNIDADSLSDLNRLKGLLTQQRQAFAAHPMPLLASRLADLQKLKALLLKHEVAIVEAINADFTARSLQESRLVEIMPCIEHIGYVSRHLSRWMKPSRRWAGWHFMPVRAKVVYQPLGIVGIMVPFNYPLTLGIVPLIVALAAGNRAMIKISEFTPRLGTLLKSILAEGFEESQVAIINGDVNVARAFSELPFDHLFFTGSTLVGKHVMRAAAANLTPVTLELGGKSPAIIADDVPLEDIIDRLVFSKSLNSGQTCVAPDYILIPCPKQQAFLEAYKAAFQRMYPTVNGNPDYTSIINEKNHQRLQDWLKDAEEKGAKVEMVRDETISDGTYRMVPRLVFDVTDEMTIMQEELFGPILPIVPYDSIDEALAYVAARQRPLALYLFSYDKALQERVTMQTHAGSMAINEALIQVGIDDLPFGGIGPSGMGQYHGREGFLTLSKAKSVLTKGKLNSMKFMYPPYGQAIQQWIFKYLLR